MGTSRLRADSAQADLADALTQGRHRAGRQDDTHAPPEDGRSRSVPPAGQTILALQRAAGNSAVAALLMARLRTPDAQVRERIDTASQELRKDEPSLEIVDAGMKEAQQLGVPVEQEAPKPSPQALAANRTGFGPDKVPQKKPTPPPKATAAVHPLARAGAKPPTLKAGGATAAKKPPAGPGPVAGGGGTGTAATAPGSLSAEQLRQPPVAPPHTAPSEDPVFSAVTHKVGGVAAAKRAHPPAAAKAAEAQGAALAPSGDVEGQAKAAKVDTMDAQPVGGFDKQAFIAAVKTAIEAKSPKTLKEADDYAESGKAGEVAGEVRGMVGQGKQGQAKDVEAATAAPPDTSKGVAKVVTPMGPEVQGPPVAVPAAGAAPKPAPAEQVNLEGGKHETDQAMAEGGVTEEQLTKSNEPEFTQALADKRDVATHADTAPAAYRAQEEEVIGQTKADAQAQTAKGLAGMNSSKATALAALVAQKGKAKSKDETRRAEVTSKIQGIFAATETAVKAILDGIDPKVDKAFTTGEAAARQAFESYVSQKMSAYKDDRYSGWRGKLRWLRDKLKGMPSKVNEFYAAGRELYLKQMDTVITTVATIVGDDLGAAKKRIAAGKTEIAGHVKSLPRDLAKVGSQASEEIGDRFEQLESDVDSKQNELVDTLATKYVESRSALDSRIEELQAENRGLIDKAIGAIKAVVNTIRGLVSMLTGVLVKAASVIGDIVSDPIGFLGNLVAGVKGGILRFKDNILTHLKKGLMGWLFGALAEGGIELPETFDLKGIVKLLASIFGLTWQNIRSRLVKQIGERAMAAVEKGVDIFQKLASGGIGAIWEMLLEKLGNIKDMILEKVQDFVVTRIITAGITWLIGLLNPAAAFIKACKMIYDVVMFFVNNGERILALVNAVLDSVADIVRGNVAAVVDKIEDVLSKMVPLLIGFLASLIGVGGIGEKVREIVNALRKPVNKALDFVVKQGMRLAGPVIRGLKSVGGKVKAGFAAGKAWVNGKVDKGKAWVKSKIHGGDDSPEGKRARLAAAQATLTKVLQKGIKGIPLKGVIAALKLRYGLKELRVEPRGEREAMFVGEINPRFELFAEAVPVIDRTAGKEGDATPKVESAFRSMSLRELARIGVGQNLGTKSDEAGLAKGEPGVSNDQLYAIKFLERKQKDQKEVSKYHYAVMVQIEFEEGAIAELMHGPHGAMDGGTANKLVTDGKGEIADRGTDGKFFVFHEKRADLPKEVRIFETSPARNKLVFKIERSPMSAEGSADNYLVVSKSPAEEGDIANLLSGKIVRVSVLGGVAGQVTPELVQETLKKT